MNETTGKVDWYNMHERAKMEIPEGGTFTFHADGGDIRVKLVRGALRIECNERLIVRPYAANVVYIEYSE